MQSDDAPAESMPSPHLSYKFQRLRERIRAAIAAGELAGKLPGERSLARQFNVNAKTLSKALTDLAAEGVLERNIGLGTFVRDGDVLPTALKIMLLTVGDDPLAECLELHGLTVYPHADPDDLPPSLVARFDLIIIGTPDVPDAVVRELIVRNKIVLTLDRLTTPFAAHALLPHASRATMQAAGQLAAVGHRRMLIIPGKADADGTQADLAEALPDVQWKTAQADELTSAIQDGFTAAVCATVAAGRELMHHCRAARVVVPETFSIAAAGRLRGHAPCSGHYVTDEECSQAIVTILETGLPQRPLTLWLAGKPVDGGTITRAPHQPADAASFIPLPPE